MLIGSCVGAAQMIDCNSNHMSDVVALGALGHDILNMDHRCLEDVLRGITNRAVELMQDRQGDDREVNS